MQRNYLVFGVANGLILATALFALLLWAYLREPLVGHFALLALLQLAGVMTVQGFTEEYLIPERPEVHRNTDGGAGRRRFGAGVPFLP